MPDNKDKWTFKRIIALIGVILCAFFVIATLVAAIADPTGVIFRSFLIVTIALPIALWIFLWPYGAMTNKHTMASVDMFKDIDTEQSQSDNESEKEDNESK